MYDHRLSDELVDIVIHEVTQGVQYGVQYECNHNDVTLLDGGVYACNKCGIYLRFTTTST